MFSRLPAFAAPRWTRSPRSAEMSKPNLLYYFRRKEDIYVALLEHTLSDWLEPLRELDPAGDPLDRTRPLHLRQDADVGSKSKGLKALRQ